MLSRLLIVTLTGLTFAHECFYRKLTLMVSLVPCHWALCPGIGQSGSFDLLQQFFFYLYTNSEWNINFACGIGKTNVLSLGGVLNRRQSTPNLCKPNLSNVKGCALPGLPYLMLHECQHYQLPNINSYHAEICMGSSQMGCEVDTLLAKTREVRCT